MARRMSAAELLGLYSSGQRRFGAANLRETHLDRADLSGASFIGDMFSGATLSYTDLSGADLGGATLRNARLRGAKLHGTVLRSANLCRANLVAADLLNADIIDAQLHGAELTDANFRGIRLGWTALGNIDLSGVRSLDTARFYAPSSISIDTLYKSQGKIPESFLRGCGVPDSFIMYMRSLVGQPVDFYSCFISYSTKDEEFAKHLHARLQQDHLRVWFAPEEMKGGQKLREQIDEAIRLYDKLLLVLSPHSMASLWVQREILKARQMEERQSTRVLFPIRLCSFDELRDWECLDSDTGLDLAREVRSYFIPDFSSWKNHDAFEASVKRLIKDLRAEGQGAAPAANGA